MSLLLFLSKRKPWTGAGQSWGPTGPAPAAHLQTARGVRQPLGMLTSRATEQGSFPPGKLQMRPLVCGLTVQTNVVAFFQNAEFCSWTTSTFLEDCKSHSSSLLPTPPPTAFNQQFQQVASALDSHLLSALGFAACSSVLYLADTYIRR